MKIEELNLSARSFNSLKRAECQTVGDILSAMDESEGGLRRFRNLGARSEAEIREKLEKARREYTEGSGTRKRSGISPESVKNANPNFTLERTGQTGQEPQSNGGSDPGVRIVLRPARNLWTREIGEFHLSRYAETRLRSCGVSRVGDLYATHPKSEPGWYAVRELFRKIAEYG